MSVPTEPLNMSCTNIDHEESDPNCSENGKAYILLQPEVKFQRKDDKISKKKKSKKETQNDNTQNQSAHKPRRGRPPKNSKLLTNESANTIITPLDNTLAICDDWQQTLEKTKTNTHQKENDDNFSTMGSVDNSLGETLASSLHLIATGGEPTQSDNSFLDQSSYTLDDALDLSTGSSFSAYHSMLDQPPTTDTCSNQMLGNLSTPKSYTDLSVPQRHKNLLLSQSQDNLESSGSQSKLRKPHTTDSSIISQIRKDDSQDSKSNGEFDTLKETSDYQTVESTSQIESTAEKSQEDNDETSNLDANNQLRELKEELKAGLESNLVGGIRNGMRKRGRKKKTVDRNDPDYISDSEMMRPILHTDGSVTLFQCEVCQKLFNKKQTLRQHFITHTDRFACEFCDSRCKSKGDLRTHIQTHTKEKPFRCDVCDTNYTRESILKKHLKTRLHLRAMFEKDDDYMLQEYGQKKRQCTSSSNFVPTKTKVKLDGFSCDKCSKMFLNKKELKKHIKSHSFKHVCNVCQKGCKTAILLKIHMRSHSSHSKLSCKSCSRKFATFQCLKDHIKSHKSLTPSKVPDEKLIKDVIYKHNKDIKMLIQSETTKEKEKKPKRTNTGVRKATFECNVCHRMFTSEKRLSNHHQSCKNCVFCTTCGKSFNSAAKLNNHMRDHDVSLIKCDLCHASYENHDQLRIHINSSHSEGSKLVCRICYKKFDSAAEVCKHMNEHAPTMLFSGDSLDENTIPVVARGRKIINQSICKIETDESSDDDCTMAGKPLQEYTQPQEVNDTPDDDTELTNSEFAQILDTVFEDDEEYKKEAQSDIEDEMFLSIIEVLESEVASSVDSDDTDDYDEDDELSMDKPIVFCHGDIVRKHSNVFEQYSLKDSCRSLFQCTLCKTTFGREKYLMDHLKCHVCEYCNKFFTDKDKLSVHKSSHVKRILNKIDTQTKSILPKNPKRRRNSLESSDSETECEENFLNALEDVLENDASKTSRSDTFLKTLSHDDIVKANKHLFDQHSFVDLANNIYACTICKRKYARPTTLTRHFKTHVCQYCNTFFIDKLDLIEHKYRHRKRAALIKAEITGEGSKMPPSPVVSKENRACFKRFSFIDTERNINRCTLCSKDFVRRTVLTRHLKTHICGHCDKFFEDKYDLIKHTTDHKVDNLFTEDDGDDEGEDFLDYTDATKRYAPTPMTTGIEKALNVPSSFQSSLGPYSSNFHTQPQCNPRNEPITYIQLPSRGNGEADRAQVFSTQNNGTPSFQIISQPVSVYKEENSDTFLVSAPNCRQNDQDKLMTLGQSQMVQSDSERERLFECGECGKRFYKNGHLKSHMTIHTGSRPFVCGVCSKAFSRGTTLRKHEKTHLKRCKICDTTFASKYELDIHLEIHRTYAFYK